MHKIHEIMEFKRQIQFQIQINIVILYLSQSKWSMTWILVASLYDERTSSAFSIFGQTSKMLATICAKWPNELTFAIQNSIIWMCIQRNDMFVVMKQMWRKFVCVFFFLSSNRMAAVRASAFLELYSMVYGR